jgi:hypothetical protein
MIMVKRIIYSCRGRIHRAVLKSREWRKLTKQLTPWR